MDFDFTDDDGDGVEVEADKQGVYLTVTGPEYGMARLTAHEAREIAHALNTAADHMEENK